MHVLLALDGVGMPTASVLLHWFDRDPCPNLDPRAAWSLGHDTVPDRTRPQWSQYVEDFRRLMAETKLPKRALDRALWQFSKENQPAG